MDNCFGLGCNLGSGFLSQQNGLINGNQIGLGLNPFGAALTFGSSYQQGFQGAFGGLQSSFPF